MNTYELQQNILKLKKEKDICILAHSYEAAEILEIADYTGDSFVLSQMATTAPHKTFLMCGVRFMAETVKILSPEKTVLIAHSEAGCPMAEQMDVAYINSIKEAHPDYTVVAYINTSAALKTISDVCVTSASAVNIVRNLPNKNILFIPDCNLGDYVAKQVPEKNIMLLDGGCPIHGKMTADIAKEALDLHKGALLLVHPECKPEVAAMADYVGSTSGIMKYAKESDAKDFIIGTEISITEHLSNECPDKNFYNMSKNLICPDMKITTLMDVYKTICGTGGMEITLDTDTIAKARVCIDKMIELG